MAVGWRNIRGISEGLSLVLLEMYCSPLSDVKASNRSKVTSSLATGPGWKNWSLFSLIVELDPFFIFSKIRRIKCLLHALSSNFRHDLPKRVEIRVNEIWTASSWMESLINRLVPAGMREALLFAVVEWPESWILEPSIATLRFWTRNQIFTSYLAYYLYCLSWVETFFAIMT